MGKSWFALGNWRDIVPPPSQKVFLTPDKPFAQVEGLYLPLVFISASLDASGRTVSPKGSLTFGYIMEGSDPKVDAVAGPEIKYLEETKGFAWEMGPGFTNRNPPGEDFLQFTFELPDRFDGVKPLELRLYGYSSEKRYPFIAGGRTTFDVVINDRIASKETTPTQALAKGGNGFDAVAVNPYLHPGKNIIRVQVSKSSKCYYYLYKIVLM